MFQRLAIPFFILVIGLFEFTIARTSDELRVTLPNGNKLIGRALRSHGGRSIKAFLGVPYAKPPVGHLRFKVNTFYPQNSSLTISLPAVIFFGFLNLMGSLRLFYALFSAIQNFERDFFSLVCFIIILYFIIFYVEFLGSFCFWFWFNSRKFKNLIRLNALINCSLTTILFIYLLFTKYLIHLIRVLLFWLDVKKIFFATGSQ